MILSWIRLLLLFVIDLFTSPFVLFINTTARFLNIPLASLSYVLMFLYDLTDVKNDLSYYYSLPTLFVLLVVCGLQGLFSLKVLHLIKRREKQPNLRPRDHFVNWVVIPLFAMIAWSRLIETMSKLLDSPK